MIDPIMRFASSRQWGNGWLAEVIGMNAIVQFIVKHGYSILFATVFAHQVGLPVPAPLFLLAAGALAAAGKLGLVPALGLAVIACVLADWVWYEAGRRRGDKVLHFIHRFARDPDAHNRRAKETFARFGLPLVVLAKFVPGLDAVAPPLAGAARTSRVRFLAFDAVGSGLYSAAYGGLGYIFSHDLDRAAAYASRAGMVCAGLAFAAISIYAACKLVQRCRIASKSLVLRITPVDPIASEDSVANACESVEGFTMPTNAAAKQQALLPLARFAPL
jgi:membrane protein DedA with SNARE-associated domain